MCGSNLGWKYLAAEDRSQRYKVGKYILETGRVLKTNHWERHGGILEDDDHGNNQSNNADNGRSGWEIGWETGILQDKVGEAEDSVILFNSEDEDELEDLFTGVWDAEKAGKRREKNRKKAAAIAAACVWETDQKI